MNYDKLRIPFWNISQTSSEKKKYEQKAEIYRTICEDPSYTRGSLITALGYRNTTVSTLVQELLDDRLIKEGPPKAANRRGRPDYYLLPNFDAYTAVAVYVAERTLFFSLLNINGDVLSEHHIDVSPQLDNDGFVDILHKHIRTLLNDNPAGAVMIGIQILLIGTVDRENLIWVDAYRWPNMHYLCFKALAYDLGYPVYLRRILDAELAYLLEVDQSLALESALIFMWGYGIGASYAYKVNILESSYGRFTDVGHTVVNPNSKKQCRCGQYGCVEAESSLPAITPELSEHYPELGDDNSEIFKVIARPEMVDIEVVNHAIDTVSLCVSNLLKTLYPKRVFMLGPFFRNSLIEEKVLDKLSNSPSRYQKDLAIQIIEEGHHRCQWGGLISLFRSKISADIEK
jgi:predicted NBD/HSP70 family sugar kinase